MILLAAVCARGSEVERLQRQVKYLSEALAAARAETDALKARLDSRAAGIGGGAGAGLPDAVVRKKEYRVLDVNRELGMVILGAGRRDGLKPGLALAVSGRNRTVALVRIVDVRTAVAGAVIEETDGGYPEVRDRAVLVTGSRK